MDKFQTRTQLLLNILLDDALEDLMLSDDRMLRFKKNNDTETFEMERSGNEYYKSRIESIRKLIQMEANSHCSAPTSIQIGFAGTNTFKEEWVSDYIR